MVVVVFAIELRPDLPVEEYEATGARMVEIVSAMGCVAMDTAARVA